MSKHAEIGPERRTFQEIEKVANKINKLNEIYEKYKHDYYAKEIETQTMFLNDLRDELQELEDFRLVYVPKYNELVSPLRKLEHFYIAV